MNPSHTYSPLTTEQIREQLGRRTFLKKILAFETISSTNAYAKRLARQGFHGPTLIVGEEQSRGRGRLGRSWHSEKGKNLLFSLVVQPRISGDRLGLLPLCVAESVARAVESRVNVPVTTKWPNDLLIEGRKVSGILLESVRRKSRTVRGTIVIGIGLNVNQTTFPEALKATSLCLATGKTIDRLQLLAAIVRSLEWLARPMRLSMLDRMLDDWKKRAAMFAKMIRVQSGDAKFFGKAIGIADDGGLLLEVDGKEQKFFAGETTVMEM